MHRIMVEVIHPWGGVAQVEASDNLLVRDFIEELVATLGLPNVRFDGRAMNYKLTVKTMGHYLPENETLLTAKVNSGQCVILSGDWPMDFETTYKRCLTKEAEDYSIKHIV